MKKYIPLAVLLAEINRLIAELVEKGEDTMFEQGRISAFEDIKLFLDSFKVKEVDDELQGIEKKVAESYVNTIDKKRIPITLKGEIKAKFKNEFNTLWQTIDGIQFANVAKHIIERLCLHFAAWGSYNLKGIGQINKDDKKEMDIKEENV